jgi:hypothetical protein
MLRCIWALEKGKVGREEQEEVPGPEDMNLGVILRRRGRRQGAVLQKRAVFSSTLDQVVTSYAFPVGIFVSCVLIL